MVTESFCLTKRLAPRRALSRMMSRCFHIQPEQQAQFGIVVSFLASTWKLCLIECPDIGLENESWNWMPARNCIVQCCSPRSGTSHHYRCGLCHRVTLNGFSTPQIQVTTLDWTDRAQAIEHNWNDLLAIIVARNLCRSRRHVPCSEPELR
ncbi:MAG: hypothetical protein J3Q66DRAFT_204058 [Benniella sp.]|nr:MAG: hypothetical protein J3Q66DRAFT_204058 [Benniella sp.]